MNMRVDTATAAFIDVAIAAGAGRGTTEIACILCGSGVPLATALRLLTRPDECRRASRLEPVLAQEALACAPGGQVDLDRLDQLLKIRVSSR